MKAIWNRMKNIHWNAVYAKEAKLRVRSIKFALTVLFYNLIMIGIAIFGFSIAFNTSFQERVNYSNAIALYVCLIAIEAGMVMFLVPAFTAGSIAGEREKQTLEILMTTTLKPRQIVWGKLMSSISMVLLLIVSTLPTISIVFTIGGVEILDLLEFVVVVFIFTLLIGSIGVWASVMMKRTVQATVFAYGGIIMLCGVSVMIVGIVWVLRGIYYYQTSAQGHPISVDVSPVLLVLLVNPICTLVEALAKQFAGQSIMMEVMSHSGNALPVIIREYWVVVSLVTQFALACFIMLLAERQLDPLRKKEMSPRKLAKLQKKEQIRAAKMQKRMTQNSMNQQNHLP